MCVFLLLSPPSNTLLSSLRSLAKLIFNLLFFLRDTSLSIQNSVLLLLCILIKVKSIRDVKIALWEVRFSYFKPHCSNMAVKIGYQIFFQKNTVQIKTAYCFILSFNFTLSVFFKCFNKYKFIMI